MPTLFHPKRKFDQVITYHDTFEAGQTIGPKTSKKIRMRSIQENQPRTRVVQCLYLYIGEAYKP